METIELTLYKKAYGRTREVCTVEYHIPPENGYKHTRQELVNLKRNGYNSPRRISRKELDERLAEGGYELISDRPSISHWNKKN